jgi:hypothetical protein
MFELGADISATPLVQSFKKSGPDFFFSCTTPRRGAYLTTGYTLTWYLVMRREFTYKN